MRLEFLFRILSSLNYKEVDMKVFTPPPKKKKKINK